MTDIVNQKSDTRQKSLRQKTASDAIVGTCSFCRSDEFFRTLSGLVQCSVCGQQYGSLFAASKSRAHKAEEGTSTMSEQYQCTRGAVSSSTDDARARRVARQCSLRVCKTRRQLDLDNFGGYQILDGRNVVLAGQKFELNADDVLEFCGLWSRNN
jgi:ribosomal protein L37AE/L43A